MRTKAHYCSQAPQGAAMPGGPTLAPAPGIETDSASKPRLCPQYRVLIHNDPVTTMDFVVYVLLQVFKLELPKAIEIMSTAHHNGLALVAVMPLEQAEHRVDQAHSLARAQKFPLKFTIEPA